MKIALVGATGLVGGVMRKVLEERGFGDCEFIPAASSRSVGKKVTFAGKMYNVVSVEEAIAQAPGKNTGMPNSRERRSGAPKPTSTATAAVPRSNDF